MDPGAAPLARLVQDDAVVPYELSPLSAHAKV